MMSSGQFSHRFDAAGTFTYTCTVHPQQMKGTVVVQ
jgi:plastocyanin